MKRIAITTLIFLSFHPILKGMNQQSHTKKDTTQRLHSAQTTESIDWLRPIDEIFPQHRLSNNSKIITNLLYLAEALKSAHIDRSNIEIQKLINSERTLQNPSTQQYLLDAYRYAIKQSTCDKKSQKEYRIICTFFPRDIINADLRSTNFMIKKAKSI